MDGRMQRFAMFLQVLRTFKSRFYGLEFKYAFILDCRCEYLRNGSLVHLSHYCSVVRRPT
jgi:hypothetical protein